MANTHGGARPGGGRPATARAEARAISERLAAIGCDPIMGMAMIAMADYEGLNLVAMVEEGGAQVARCVQEISIELRAAMYKELAQYVAPKRRAVDFGGQSDEPAKIYLMQFGQPDKVIEQTPEMLKALGNVVAPEFDEEETDGES